ncbi:MAG: phosphoribosylformimino-5-aminoimidazole carboxamide ribotide isomerase [Euryarchaeota archaeon]|nr:phosphoribosylformimino-5-aminoimidazole carboxamide ribotide isomerase [Euryarchaeota archaeon]MBU4138365.1 phosphoribosylformimino-5-aminoimidazole carboxamide ribotide isomerase [Euryarchaeota archaeon]
MFRIIFVLDILNGTAVHAVRGERSKYKPVTGSRVCDSSSPLDLISAVSPREVYIADLDRLLHQGDNFELIKEISDRTRTMADIGPESMNDVKKCEMIADTVILGTETASFDLIETAAIRFPGRINVSIDMKNGKVLARDRNLEIEPLELVRKLNDHNIRDIIILDLARVGTGAGIDLDLLMGIAAASSHDVLVGGGIKDMDDIKALEQIGISGALVATAVHSGKIPADLIRKK